MRQVWFAALHCDNERRADSGEKTKLIKDRYAKSTKSKILYISLEHRSRKSLSCSSATCGYDSQKRDWLSLSLFDTIIKPWRTCNTFMVSTLHVGCQRQLLGLLFAHNSWSLSTSLRQYMSLFKIAIQCNFGNTFLFMRPGRRSDRAAILVRVSQKH